MKRKDGGRRGKKGKGERKRREEEEGGRGGRKERGMHGYIIIIIKTVIYSKTTPTHKQAHLYYMT